MIHNQIRFREVLEEIAEWDLVKRREYIADIENAFGMKSAQQLKDGLIDLWKRKQA